MRCWNAARWVGCVSALCMWMQWHAASEDGRAVYLRSQLLSALPLDKIWVLDVLVRSSLGMGERSSADYMYMQGGSGVARGVAVACWGCKVCSVSLVVVPRAPGFRFRAYRLSRFVARWLIAAAFLYPTVILSEFLNIGILIRCLANSLQTTKERLWPLQIALY